MSCNRHIRQIKLISVIARLNPIRVSAVLDLFSRQVIGWSMGPRMDRDLAINALLMACGVVSLNRPSWYIPIKVVNSAAMTGKHF